MTATALFVGFPGLVAGLTCTAPSAFRGTVQLSEHVWWGESMLSDAVADRLLAKLPTSNSGWGRCTSAVQQTERTCYKIDLRDDSETRELLGERLAHAPFSIDATSLEFLSVTRSTPGAPEYPHHVDHADEEWRGKGAVPQYTAAMYLSTMKQPNSGALVFDGAAASIQPAKGDVVIFQNSDGSSIHAPHHEDVAHRVTPVADDEAEARIMVQFIMHGGESNSKDDAKLMAFGSGSGNSGGSHSHAAGDPHFTTAHGDRFDYKGKHDTIYNLLSHTNVSVNALFKHSDYKRPGPKQQLVHGSFMRELYATIRTNTSRLMQVEYSSFQPTILRFGERGSAVAAVRAGKGKQVDDVTFELDHDRTLTIKTSEWIVKVNSKVTPSIVDATKCADGRCAIHVSMSPRFNTSQALVAPHGLIGQSYDGDNIGIVGAVDDYKGAEFTTSAMGEGAIEGEGGDYEVASKFDTNFAFSRFGKTTAKPRDVGKLSGKKIKHNDTSPIIEAVADGP